MGRCKARQGYLKGIGVNEAQISKLEPAFDWSRKYSANGGVLGSISLSLRSDAVWGPRKHSGIVKKDAMCALHGAFSSAAFLWSRFLQPSSLDFKSRTYYS